MFRHNTSRMTHHSNVNAFLFFSRYFPSCSKTAKAIPVQKINNESDLNNYRPISILSCLLKIKKKFFIFFKTFL